MTWTQPSVTVSAIKSTCKSYGLAESRLSGRCHVSRQRDYLLNGDLSPQIATPQTQTQRARFSGHSLAQCLHYAMSVSYLCGAYVGVSTVRVNPDHWPKTL